MNGFKWSSKTDQVRPSERPEREKLQPGAQTNQIGSAKHSILASVALR